MDQNSECGGTLNLKISRHFLLEFLLNYSFCNSEFLCILYYFSGIILSLLNRLGRCRGILNITVCDLFSNSSISKEVSGICSIMFWSFWGYQLKCPEDIE